MAKRKKTREQKIAANLKRQEHHVSYSLNDIPPLTKQTLVEHKQEKYASYSYVITDLKKTMYLTLFIIFAQMILLLLLQHRIITLPGVVY